eukprot:TRINITY_DN14462_c0_g1_i1.p1 TRINITY_DN14462_c0_g1~~TRINITY_DN14462_c0_g1_i1.p1  ORF type:complete len:317 (-),score=47.56 TRINITY_DN14462_c0_g1_i1:131-1081(-)
MRAAERKSPMPVVVTSRFSLALFKLRDSYSDRTRETLAAAFFPSVRSFGSPIPYHAVVNQLSKISKEIEGIIDLPRSLRIHLSSSSFSMTSSPAYISTRPPVHAFTNASGCTPTTRNSGTFSFGQQPGSLQPAPFPTIATGFGSGPTSTDASFQWPEKDVSHSFGSAFATGPQGAGSVSSASNSLSSSPATRNMFSFASSNAPLTSPATLSFAATGQSSSSSQVPAKFRSTAPKLATPSFEAPPKFSFGAVSSLTTFSAPESAANAPLSFTFASPSSSSSFAPAPKATNSFSSTASSSATPAEESQPTSAAPATEN